MGQIEKGDAEIVKEDVIEKEEEVIENEESNNQGNLEESWFTLDQLIDKNSPLRRAKKQVLSDPNPEWPDYIKPLYHITKTKLVHENEAGMFEKFKEM